MGTDRSPLSCRPLAILFATLLFSGVAHAATLEESARELAAKMAAIVPAGQAVSCEIRNSSTLVAAEVSRIEHELRAGMPGCGAAQIQAQAGVDAVVVIVTLSENWQEMVWTAEVRQRDAVRTVLLAVPRTGDGRSAGNSMHVTVRSEKLWEGPERILDALQVSNGAGKSWLVLLYPNSLAVQDLQSGVAGKVGIPIPNSNVRDPHGKLIAEDGGNSVWATIAEQSCKINLETRESPQCILNLETSPAGPRSFRSFPDLTPAATTLLGMGMELVIDPACGGTNQFLATSARDYTQTDSLQVFQLEPNGPAAMSAELDFPGPILDLHSAPGADRAIVRNLATGNYEAYRLDISCGQ